MKKINMNDAIGKIGDELLEKAIETDTSEKLKELKRLQKNKKRFSIFKYLSICACSFVIILGGIMLNSGNYHKNVQIPNPIMTINSLSELSEYLGVDVSNLSFKSISNINKYNDDILGEIIYNDNSKLRISKGRENNSGIYGWILKEETIIKNVNVQIYTYEDLEYGVWENKGYSFSYIKSESEDINKILEIIIEEVK